MKHLASPGVWKTYSSNGSLIGTSTKKPFLFSLVIFSFLILILEIYDIYNPSDSGDMRSLNYYIQTRKASDGNIKSALHLAQYHGYNSEFRKEYEILINLITSNAIKTPSEWEAIIGLSIENCHYTGYMHPEEIAIGFDNAKKQDGLNSASIELKNRWENGGFSKCLPK